MILLNKDYSNIKKQVMDLKSNEMNTNDIPTIYDLLETRYALYSNIDPTVEGSYFQPPSYIQSIRIVKYRNNIDKLMQKNFQINKDFHEIFFQTSLIVIREMIEKLEEEIPFIDPKDYHVLKKNQDIEIVTDFLKEEDIVLKDIFNDMRKKKQIYAIKKGSDPNAVYNNFQDIPNIFLPKNRPTIEMLISLMHELGHIRDYQKVCQENPQVAITYSYYSLYCEVMSSYYEQKFYSYLIQNNIHRKEVQNEMLTELELLEVSLKKCKKKMHSQDANYDKLFSNCQYAYGPIIANSLIIEPKKKEEFWPIHCDEFSEEKLAEIDLMPKRLTKDLVKSVKRYF